MSFTGFFSGSGPAGVLVLRGRLPGAQDDARLEPVLEAVANVGGSEVQGFGQRFDPGGAAVAQHVKQHLELGRAREPDVPVDDLGGHRERGAEFCRIDIVVQFSKHPVIFVLEPFFRICVYIIPFAEIIIFAADNMVIK